MAKPTKTKLTKQQKQMYALGGLLGFLALVVAYNVFAPSKRPAAPARPAPAANGTAPQKGGTGNTVASNKSFGPIEVLPIDYAASMVEVQTSRNVFDYPPPPPPPRHVDPPIVKPPPPTINLGAVSPAQAIAGTSKPIAVTLTGSFFPADSRVYLNDQPIAAQRVSATVIRATIPPASIASPGALAIKVKSASQPTQLWSDPVRFQLTPSPEPGETFVYSGRVGAQAVLTFKDPSKRAKLVTVGETVNGSVPWKVLSINDKQVDLLDTRNDIRKSLGLVAKGR